MPSGPIAAFPCTARLLGLSRFRYRIWIYVFFNIIPYIFEGGSAPDEHTPGCRFEFSLARLVEKRSKHRILPRRGRVAEGAVC